MSKDAPRNGRDAMMSGWDTRACPYESNTPEAMLWLSDWWRANAECFADHIGRPLAPGLGMLTGLRDRTGQPIHIGDTLSFDEQEWGSPHQFKVTLLEGDIQYSGVASDMDQHCEIVKKWTDA